eukprot:COSAG06_NODE_1862_length_8199_cov_7.440741_1_plen_95_part_10
MDDPAYTDPVYNDPCSAWADYDCFEGGDLDAAQADSLRVACPSACGVCGGETSGTSAAAAAAPPPPPAPAPADSTGSVIGAACTEDADCESFFCD